MPDEISRPASLLSLIEKDLPYRPAWITKGVLRQNGLLVFGGLAKIGKSFLMLEIARALAAGDIPFGHPQLEAQPPSRVLVIEQEVGEEGLQERARLIFAGENALDYGPNLWYVSKVPEMQLSTPAGRKILYSFVEQVQPNVLILDPIGRMHGYDENKSDQIQELITGLDLLAKKYEPNGMSIVFSHHYGKPATGDPRNARDPLDPYNFRGSTKWFDCPDSLITVQRLGNLPTPWKSWEVKVRFETRQAEPPEEVILGINEQNDLRVRFKKMAHQKPPPQIERTVKTRVFPGVGNDWKN